MLTHSTAEGQGRYVRLQGQILSSLPGAEAIPFHLDAYKITADGQRQLVRLSRFSGPDYHLYLEAGSEHEVLIQMLDHPPYLVRIEAGLCSAIRTGGFPTCHKQSSRGARASKCQN